MKQRADISYMLFLAVTAAVGGLLFGYDTAVISGTVELVTARFGLDSLQQGWYVGCALAGSIAGVLCAGVLSDRLGRRRTMLVSAVLFTVSAAGRGAVALRPLCGFPQLPKAKKPGLLPSKKVKIKPKTNHTINKEKENHKEK